MDKKSQKDEQRRIAENQVEASRSEHNSKHKRTGITLNVLIILVGLAIVGVLWLVFFLTADDSKEPTETKPKTEQTQKADEAKKDDTKPKETEKPKETTEKSDDPNVSQVIKKDWKPVGTEQKGDHVNSYEMKSQDWEEKVNAFSKATGIDKGDMTIWYVGRGEDPATQSIGTVTTKSDPDTAFRVYITWIDGEGWKPTKVEELKTNDKRN
ncbi:DUF1510 family protein [Listeria grandensis]|uniref:YrrS family protein n=1 Tax=Listeria grandensis TaxID=1494963 RepID=UPI001629D13E|nr:YrrS family protein [Listeria grandensis]MBC1473615.1 DUF1510 family protein [Listeria grandensis]